MIYIPSDDSFMVVRMKSVKSRARVVSVHSGTATSNLAAQARLWEEAQRISWYIQQITETRLLWDFLVSGRSAVHPISIIQTRPHIVTVGWARRPMRSVIRTSNRKPLKYCKVPSSFTSNRKYTLQLLIPRASRIKTVVGRLMRFITSAPFLSSQYI